MEKNMDEPRKRKRKADNSEKIKSNKLMLVDEAEAKRVKKPPASEVQPEKAKTIQSKSSKRSFIEVEKAQTKIVKSPASRRARKVKESIFSSESSDNEEQPKNHTNKNKTVKNPIPISSDSESTSDNEKQPQSFRKNKLNKNPIPIKNSSNSESSSNDQEEEKMFKGLKDSIYIQNSSDSESTSDNEEETQRLRKEKIIRAFKEPIHIQNSSDSESSSESDSDGEDESQRFSKKKMVGEFKDSVHIQNGIGNKSISHKKEQEILNDENCETRKENDLMSKEDQLILIKRIQEYIPDDDHRSYHYRLKQLEWHKVAFKNYTIDQCKRIWSQLFKKVRHYRLLQEITSDIQEILKFNDLQSINMNPIKKIVKKHPGMPDRPMSSYFIYYTKHCDKLAKKRPDLHGISFERYIIEKYRQLSSEEKQKYDLMAMEMRKEYEVKLAQFYDEHPQVKKEKPVYKKNIKVQTEKPPKEPEKAFGLFLISEMKNQTPEDRTQFRKDCREKWKQLPDLVKLDWINRAEEGIIEYQKKLAQYMARHPKFIPKTSARKSGLTKEEKCLKEKLSGKPKRPPLTPLRLFVSTIASNAETVPSTERWKYCLVKWKALPQEEKDRYFELLKKKHRKYEKDFSKYLDSLTEDERQKEIVLASKKLKPKL
ncbi:unnamed protein product [Ceutorhynchus assimilis]|uniref:HMG box domain-containing protein n=1 Tax=Ceutorhynchus assimilis TaxID=467358 RepID=A0A9N9MJC3_9CUCU|nr:unnamed protein product [Ceutorhynchus assimilis]